MKRLIVAIGCLMLAGCGGRVAQPLQMTRDIDPSLTCDHLRAEYDNNLRRRTELTGESSDKVRDNLGMLLASPLLLDLSDSQKIEAKSIVERNLHLEDLARQKNCPALTATPNPA